MRCEKCERTATVHISDVTDEKVRAVHLCQECASASGHVNTARLPEKLQAAIQQMRVREQDRIGYYRVPRDGGVEFILPRVRLPRAKLLLPIVYFVMQSAFFILSLFSLANVQFGGMLLSKLFFIPAIALFPLTKGAMEQLVTAGVTIRAKPDRLIVPVYPPVKPPVEVPLSTIARFELDLPPRWQERIGYRTPKLLAEHYNGSRTVIVLNRQPEVLKNLAEDLRRFARSPRHFFEVGSEVSTAESANISIADVSEIPSIERDVISKPDGSKIRSVQEGNLHTFYMRNGGLFRNRIFLLMYGGVTVIPLLILGPIVMRGMMAPAKWRPGGLPIIAFGDAVVVAALVGIIVGIHCWSKKYVLVVGAIGKERGSLTCISRGIFGGREMVFERGEIHGVSTRGSQFLKAMHIHETEPQAVLYMIDARGRKRVLLSGEELEMRWVATQIRVLLDLPRK